MRTPVGLLLALSFIATVFAGCGEKDFHEAAPEWASGYKWEYRVERVDSEVERGGEGPDAASAEEERRTRHRNETQRLEIFNTTTVSSDGVALYVGALYRRQEPSNTGGAGGAATIVPGYWEAAYFTQANVNPLTPAQADLAGGLITVRDDEGNDNEEPMFRFPLTRGKTWSSAQPDLDIPEVGTTEHSVGRMESRGVPAGSFEAIKVTSRFKPRDARALEDLARSYLEAQGYRVDSLKVNVESTSTVYYAPEVKNVIERIDVQAYHFEAAGRDGEGRPFSFFEQGRETVTHRLLTYSLSPAVERPLSFVLSVVLGGDYRVAPITPLADFVGEIVVSVPELNAAVDENTVEFGVRLYNTSMGEKRLRGEDALFPAVAAPSNVDAEKFTTEWVFSRSDGINETEVFRSSSSKVTLDAARIGGAGLLSVSLKLGEKSGGTELNVDTVLYEVYTRKNVTITATQENVTRGYVHADFDVGPGAKVLRILTRYQDAGQPHNFARLRAYDADGSSVPNERGNGDRFYSTRLSQFLAGSWQVRLSEGVAPYVNTAYTFDIEVRYRDPSAG